MGDLLLPRTTADIPAMLAWCTATTGCSIPDDELDSLNGPVHVPAGETRAGLRVVGSVVLGPGATLADSHVTGFGAVYAAKGPGSATLVRCTVDGGTAAAVSGASTVNCDISRAPDGVKLGSGSAHSSTWVHNLTTPAGHHGDGMQCSGGATGILVERCVIQGSNVSAVKLSTNFGPILDAWILDSYLAGGVAFYFEDKDRGYGPPTGGVTGCALHPSKRKPARGYFADGGTIANNWKVQ